MKLKLKLSIYKPAFNRKDVRRRVELALEHYLAYYRTQKEMTWSVPQLEKWFGKHQNDMFKWLKANLLREVRSYSVQQGRAITYVLNQTGFDKVWLQLHGHAFDYATERARQVEPLFRPYLDADHPLGMALPKIEGGRLYWTGQNVEKVVRRVILKGSYDYDIQAAMPTLVLQSVAAREGLNWREAFPTWARYLGSRKAFRESLADRLNITYAQAKDVCQGMFDLRTFTAGRKGVSELIGREKMGKAKDDLFLKALRAEALRAWGIVGLSGRDDGTARFRYYEQVEQYVMQAVYETVSEAGIRCLPFHDGLTLLDGRAIADLDRFQRLIRDKTGFNVLLEETVL